MNIKGSDNMSTEKLYYENQYIKEFEATIKEIIIKDDKYHISLDKTAFFPGGGGQHCDIGKIDNYHVIDVYERNNIIYHVLEEEPKKLNDLKCSIDWENRFDGMQQHLAQHVLSGCFFTLFNANTVSIHLGEEISTVDIMGYLEEEQVEKAEIMANEVIRKKLNVKSYVPSKKELKKMKLRRTLPKTKEEIRILEIEDLDINACCGVHPKSTLDLQLIRIKKMEKNKGNTRVEFLSGKRAVEDYIKSDKFLLEVSRYLNSGNDEILSAIKNLNDNIKSLSEENRKIKSELANYEMKEILEKSEKVKDITIVRKEYINENIKYINKLIAKIIDNPKTIALFGIKYDDKANLIFACSDDIKNINMNNLLKDAVILIDGKGGGRPTMAQGAGKSVIGLESALDYASRKIKENI